MDKEWDIIGIKELDARPENPEVVLFESKLYRNKKGFQRDYSHLSHQPAHALLVDGLFWSGEFSAHFEHSIKWMFQM